MDHDRLNSGIPEKINAASWRGDAALRAKLEAAQKAAAASPKIATADTVITGDPGPVPECLQRNPEQVGASGSHAAAKTKTSRSKEDANFE